MNIITINERIVKKNFKFLKLINNNKSNIKKEIVIKFALSPVINIDKFINNKNNRLTKLLRLLFKKLIEKKTKKLVYQNDILNLRFLIHHP